MSKRLNLSERAGRPASLRLAGGRGRIDVDLSRLHLSEEQASALSALFTAGDITRVPEEDRAALEQIEVNLGGSAAEGPFIRFDLKVVRINKAPSLDWEAIEEITLVQEARLGGQ